MKSWNDELVQRAATLRIIGEVVAGMMRKPIALGIAREKIQQSTLDSLHLAITIWCRICGKSSTKWRMPWRERQQWTWMACLNRQIHLLHPVSWSAPCLQNSVTATRVLWWDERSPRPYRGLQDHFKHATNPRRGYLQIIPCHPQRGYKGLV